jgi:hypothetical protein
VLAINRAKDRAAEALKPITDPTFPAFPGEDPTDDPTDDDGQSTDDPAVPDPGATGKTITVEYEITGDGPATIIYAEKLGDSPKRVENADLPWKLEVTMQGAALISVTGIRTGSSDGSISCRATVDGDEVAQRTRDGMFASANCTKLIF